MSKTPSEFNGRIVAERNPARNNPIYPSEMKTIKKGSTKADPSKILNQENYFLMNFLVTVVPSVPIVM